MLYKEITDKILKFVETFINGITGNWYIFPFILKYWSNYMSTTKLKQVRSLVTKSLENVSRDLFKEYFSTYWTNDSRKDENLKNLPIYIPIGI